MWGASQEEGRAPVHIAAMGREAKGAERKEEVCFNFSFLIFNLMANIKIIYAIFTQFMYHMALLILA